MEQKFLGRIAINPKVMVGKPVIKGTRIPVDLIIKLVAQGMTEKEILEDYPHLTKDDIKAALLYGAEIVSSETILPITEK
ncbi:DUF433 domain-containing protein [Candidatus Woesearchaeota archaeon]|nr:DUF433 domain-containing protein [Candidatus Woesearchaeota archaeon]MBI2130607.1 DUF433 domain-containing protein [Candidatus Woesearchaeota archaeon]MBI2661303.1 DUF433 domain-containing protein [Candidatus Woesearchaeota archaeon]